MISLIELMNFSSLLNKFNVSSAANIYRCSVSSVTSGCAPNLAKSGIRLVKKADNPSMVWIRSRSGESKRDH